MCVTNPLNSIPQGKKLATFLYLLVATVAMSAVFRFIGPFTPTIVDYEFAGSVAKAAVIISAWAASSQLLTASFNLGFDYLYMPVYSTTIALTCVWGSLMLSRRAWRGFGMFLTWGLWLAATFDAVENYALVAMLLGTIADPYPQIAAACATCKFGLIALGLVYAGIAAVIWIVLRIKSLSEAHAR